MFNGIRLWFSYKRQVNTENPDAIISFLTETNIIALTHKYKNCRLIVSERNDPTRYSKVTQKVIKMLYSKADILVCQSKRVKEYFNCPSSVVIPNPIDKKIIPNIYSRERRKVIVSVGRLTEQKNFANLITAFSMLESSFEEYKLEIYGEGYLHSNLEKLIKKFNLSHRIKLMGAHKNVLEMINDASLFVMSSDYEGYPNALAEAMAIGLPVISTDFYSGTAKELIGKENGILVPVDNSRALADAMEELLSDSDRRRKISLKNLKIREEMSVENIADKWLEVIE